MTDMSLSPTLIRLFAPGMLIASCDAGQPQPPNIVVFMIDDLGYSDVGCYGSQYYETPNIDMLAEAGTRFTTAYAASMVRTASVLAASSGITNGN